MEPMVEWQMAAPRMVMRSADPARANHQYGGFIMRVASDIGGTFTDLVYLDEASGELGVAKASTTPANFAEGVIETFHKADLNVPDTDFFVHGSTVIINALTERKGVKTALITTKVPSMKKT
jgi:N-methylhydantoinase A/oxoprolinase/acetone carboxylase beta subunit